jgi:phosphotransferase system HPr (HPr) family protein
MIRLWNEQEAMITQKLIVTNKVGLHARPAAVFVKTAGQFHADIRVRNLTRPSDWVTAKSILRVLTLGVEKNHEIEISAEGEDAQLAITTITSLIQSNFGEST